MTDHSSQQSSKVDHDEKERLLTDEPNADLLFPQLLLHASFDSLLTHSYPSSSSTVIDMTNSRNGLASLGESWASLDDVEHMNDEDLQSETTDAGSLLDVHGSEDVHSLQDDEISSESGKLDDSDAEEQSRESTLREGAASSIQDLPKTPTLASSGVTTNRLNQITLDEPQSAPSERHVALIHTLQVFSPSEVARMKMWTVNHKSGQGCVGTIHMTLSSTTLEATGRRSFRLLLFGKDCTPSLRTKILEKLGDVLVAGETLSNSTVPQTPSRYHVVPDSFGPGSQPTAAEIIPIEWQLEVEQYHVAIYSEEREKIGLWEECPPKRIGKVSTWDGEKYSVNDPSWTRPDLAVVFVGRNDGSKELHSTRNILHFSKRHNIPIIMLRLDNDWNARFDSSLFLNTQALMCIENRPLSSGRMLQKLPIDLDTFFNLNSGQLNRHIAYLIDSSGEMSKSAATRVNKSEKPEHCKTAITTTPLWLEPFILVRENRPVVARLVLQLLAVLMLAVAINFGLGISANLLGSISSPTGSLTVPTSTPSAAAANLSSTVSSSRAVRNPMSSSNQLVLPNWSTHKTIQGSYRFEVNMTDHSHILVRTPAGPKIVEREENLKVTVHRGELRLQPVVKCFVDRIYSVRLDPSEAFGEVAVRLEMRKPAIVEVIKVDLGPKLYVDGWKGTLSLVEKQINQTVMAWSRSINEFRTSKVQIGREWARSIESSAMQVFIPKLKREAQQIVITVHDRIPDEASLHRFQNEMEAWARCFKASSASMLVKFADAAVANSVRGKQLIQEVSSSTTHQAKEILSGLKDRLNLQHVSETVLEQARSEKMATAQDRAQQIMMEVASRLKTLRRGW